jgi:2,4-dienoyl-CoA reductase-like NADH-dependent reductase (Old Yellow Enzyme family)
MYSAREGMPNPWHLIHLGSFAIHGAGTIIVEATAVTPEGRITPCDLGIWSDAHTPAFADLVKTLKTVAPGVTVGIQLAHAGRKASTWVPFDREAKQHPEWMTKEEGGFPDDVLLIERSA